LEEKALLLSFQSGIWDRLTQEGRQAVMAL
jgi:hypothetical protein